VLGATPMLPLTPAAVKQANRAICEVQLTVPFGEVRILRKPSERRNHRAARMSTVGLE